MTLPVLPLARRIIVTLLLKKSSFIPHFTNDRPQPSTSSNVAYVVPYDTPFQMSGEAMKNRLSRIGVVSSSRHCKLQPCPVFSTEFVFLVWRYLILSLLFLRFGRYLLLRHKDQTFSLRKCVRPGHQARMCSNIFCFNCEELGHMTDSCPKEFHCCICLVSDHMRADCSFSWNRRSLLLRSDTSDTPATPFPVVCNVYSVFSTIHQVFLCDTSRTVFAVF